MNISHIEHIGIAVSNLEEAIAYYEGTLGLKCYAIEEVVDQKVKTAFFQVGDTKIELLESTDLVLTDTDSHADLSAWLTGVSRDKYLMIPVGTDEATFLREGRSRAQGAPTALLRGGRA